MDSSLLWMVAVFSIGYLAIIFEHVVKIDKAAVALLTGIACWMIYFHLGLDETPAKVHQLSHHLSSIAQVLFFLLGAMLIVETIDSHQGFDMIGPMLQFKSRTIMFWAAMFVSFFVSAVLDNLTTIIVMITLLKKVIPEAKQRLLFTTALVVAVNAGGAWTPIGDVTTTMLWIAERITAQNIMIGLLIPSLVSLVVFGLLLMPQLPKQIDLAPVELDKKTPVGSKRVFCLGLLAMVMVPVLKATLGIPPFMGIALGVALLWILTDYLHQRDSDQNHLRFSVNFGRIDMACIAFFFGMLLAVDALQSVGALGQLSLFIGERFESYVTIGTLIGLLSAVVDNIPLVAALIEMYPLSTYPTDHQLWELIAFTAGTGGSLLIIGSAAGVACMSLERVSFTWYVRHISWAALISYFAGIAVWALLRM